MSEAAVVNTEALSTPGLRKPVPAVPFPKAVQGVAFAGFRRWMMRTAIKRYGPVFAINVPYFGRTVMMADPALVRQVFLASTDDLMNVQPNLSRIFGPVFALDGAQHSHRRKLLAPPFHGQSIKNYEKVIEEETLRESANWPEGKEFRTLEPMNGITLNVILRTVFGAAFANTEMDVVLRTVLRHFTIETDNAPDEKIHFRGIAYTPKDGGRIVVHRRELPVA
jgi:cytochrome P450 family 138